MLQLRGCRARGRANRWKDKTKILDVYEYSSELMLPNAHMYVVWVCQWASEGALREPRRARMLWAPCEHRF